MRAISKAGLAISGPNEKMASYIRPGTERTFGLDSTELVTLKGVPKHEKTDGPIIKRLHKLGLIERKSGTWDLTEQGYICLMFAAAR